MLRLYCLWVDWGNLAIGVSVSSTGFCFYPLGGEERTEAGLFFYLYIPVYSSLLSKYGEVRWPILISSRNQANLIRWMKKYFPTELLHSSPWLVCLQLLHTCHLLMALFLYLYLDIFTNNKGTFGFIYSQMTFTVWYWRIGWEIQSTIALV